MRLDKYLKVSRIVKRRTIANELCDAQKVRVNDRAARASYAVKLNDVIQVTIGARTIKVVVKNLSEHTTKENAGENYELIK